MEFLSYNLGGLFLPALTNPRRYFSIALANGSTVRIVDNGVKCVDQDYEYIKHLVDVFIVFIYIFFYWHVFSLKFDKPLFRMLAVVERFWLLVMTICVLYYDPFLGFALIFVMVIKQGYLAYLCYKYKTFDFLTYNTTLMFYLNNKKQAYTHFCDYHSFITLCGGNKHVNLNGVLCPFDTLDQLCLTVVGKYELILPNVRKVDGLDGDSCFIFSKEPVVSIINILNCEAESEYVAVDL
ncbi:ORF3 protein [Wenzhou Suncus murinus alphacoronavirus 1]|nr:ORF3 protein [Wenzhou Suncus murinus alphacoronavirus 1]